MWPRHPIESFSRCMYERLAKLAAGVRQHDAPVAAHAGEETIEVSVPASTAASFYEKVRNTLDYQEEHLLRRNAIERILSRYRGSGETSEQMAADLLKELVWAKYLPNKSIPLSLGKTVAIILAKYEPLFTAVMSVKGQREKLVTWLLDVVSTEVEYTLAPPTSDEALASFMYEEMRSRIDWDPKFGLSDEAKDLRLYTAIHRTLLKSNPATLRYRLLTLYYPAWAGAQDNQQLIDELARNIVAVISTIETEIFHPLTDKLGRVLRRKAGIFRVLRDALAHTKDVKPLLTDPAALDDAVKGALHHRTKDFNVRLRRTVVRAVAFLFITKMLLALVIEVPYDLLIAKDANWYPLLINITFHPVFLALIGLTVSIPDKKNAEDYLAAARAVAVGAPHQLLAVRVRRESGSTVFSVFGAIYAVLFLVVYGVIGSVLHGLGFHALSIALFLFFISLVTFFGIRIRSSTKDIVASDARNGFIGTAFDIVMLPIVRAGAWLSIRVAKINVFIYFFDFIIEAPLKVAIEFVESWLNFVREKKEEI